MTVKRGGSMMRDPEKEYENAQDVQMEMKARNEDMTNDRAVEVLKAIIFLLDKDDYSDEVEEAIHMAINALKAQELSNDSPELDKENGELTRRKAAIEALKEAFNPSITNFVKAKIAIDKLPSEQPDLPIKEKCAFCPHCNNCDVNDDLSIQPCVDTISIQAANAAICNACGMIDCDQMDKCEKLFTAQPETHEKRTETHSCDCISRQAAIDAIRVASGYCHPSNVAKELAKLPPVEPERKFTDRELEVFAHGISLKLLSKKSAQHWHYEDKTAEEIEFLEGLYEKVKAEMEGEG